MYDFVLEKTDNVLTFVRGNNVVLTLFVDGTYTVYGPKYPPDEQSYWKFSEEGRLLYAHGEAMESAGRWRAWIHEKNTHNEQLFQEEECIKAWLLERFIGVTSDGI